MDDEVEGILNYALKFSQHRVDLSEHRLTTLPESISTLTNLKQLLLSSNKLGTLPSTISTLTNLKLLNLNNNQLLKMPEPISALTNLEDLKLNSNHLTTIPSSVSSLTKLYCLDLRSNQLTTLPDSISTLTNLKLMFINSNQLKILPESITTLTSLTELYLHSNQLTILPPSISALTNLEQLKIGQNQITSLPEAISTLSKLCVLNVNGNQLTALPSSLLALNNLKQLDISSNQLTKLPLEVVVMSGIADITIEDNPIKSKIIQQKGGAIWEHYVLHYLQLPQKKIVVVGEGHVGKTSLIKRLKDVWFYGLQPSTRTEGVDIHSIEISKDKYISVWDFAGQEHFLSSHKLYFTKNSVFIVVVQLTDSINVIKNQLSKWLFTIHQLCPDTQVIIVATKMDLVKEQQLQEKTIQLEHVISILQHEFSVSIQPAIGNLSYFTISNEKQVNISKIKEILIGNLSPRTVVFINVVHFKGLSKESVVKTFKSSVGLLHSIKLCKELCVGVKSLVSMSYIPRQQCMQALQHLEELGMIVYVESNAEDEDATVILNGDLISKAFNKLKMKCRELTKSELTGWIDYNLAKSTVSRKIKFKMFIDVIEKAKLVYIDRKSDYETQWKIFIPHIVLDNNLQPIFSQDIAHFSTGRLFYFKHQLPIGFFEHLAIQMQFLVKLASYSIMISSCGIKIVGNASAVFIERIKLDGEFINAIRMIAVNKHAPQLFHQVVEAFEECLFAYFKNDHDVHKFVKCLVICSCQHCQVKFKNNQLTKQQYLPLTQDDTIQEGIASILTQYIKGQKASGCIDSNASIPLTDLLVELLMLKDLPFINFNTIKMHKHEVRGKGGFGTVRVGVLSNGQRVAVKEINDVHAFKEIGILRQVHHKHIVKVLGYSCHESSGSAHMFIITELLDKSLSQLIAKNGSLVSDIFMLVRVGLNISKGLLHLHTQHPPIIHRDIKPDNIMFDESMNVKIIDLNIAKQAALPSLYEQQGSPGYCAPEVIGQTKYNSAADIYSVGCVLSAMCGDMPKTSPLLAPLVTQLQTLIEWCCDKEPSKRPTAIECIECLKSLLDTAKMLKEKHGDQFKIIQSISISNARSIVSSKHFAGDNMLMVNPYSTPQICFASKEDLRRELNALRLTIRDNLGSGDCLPYSLIDYLKVLTDFQGDCDELRQLIANYARQNWRYLVENYPKSIGEAIINEDEANQWATQYQQPQQWCDTDFACVCACVFRLKVNVFVLTEHQMLERMVFEPIDADLSQPTICLAYVKQNHFVSVWPEAGDELLDIEDESTEELTNNQHSTCIVEQTENSRMTLQKDAQDIPDADLMMIQKLGEGGFGEVWLAQWRGIKVAVKKMKSTMADSLLDELKTLALLRYKYIVTLSGISTDSKTGNLMLVMEYMKHGSLDDLLFKQNVKMSLSDVIQIALDVAKGINFLHMQKPIIIHRDLKSANILLHFDKKRAKIADFGAAKALHSNIQLKTVIGAFGIAMPPEMMDELSYDEKVDIFSFGVVLYEMFTNDRLRMMEEHNQRFARIRANVSNKDLAELIVTCCAVDPKQRPSITKIIDELKVLKKNMAQ